MYVPRPVEFQCLSPESSPQRIAEEILALTKMNWNNTQFDSFFPITLKAARQVGNILRHLSGEAPELTRYAYYM